ncbi:MAG TPA: molecular chaperone TorD family protein [Rhabdaerophilum sp.]|nr:molecular chaperone TorD family protein [Rhabdaerophilum sp.]
MNVAIREIRPEKQAQLSVCAEDLRLLMHLHDREVDAPLLAGLKEADFPHCLALKGDDAADISAFEIFGGALDGDEGSGTPAALDALHADFAAIYLNHTYSVSPLECVWLDPEGLILQEPMFEIRQWYAHYELAARNWRVRSDDHLAYQLEFIAHLLTHPLDHGPKDAAAFMDHHVLRWIEPFAARVSTRCRTQFYAGLALVTVSVLGRLRKELVRLAGMPLVEPEPIEEEKQRRRAMAQEEAGRFLPGAAPSW